MKVADTERGCLGRMIETLHRIGQAEAIVHMQMAGHRRCWDCALSLAGAMDMLKRQVARLAVGKMRFVFATDKCAYCCT
ncbi:hypothetical protein IB264_30300 [Ensifer sp. ENS11]|nr:hypothetical protein [Ensifer sp. ENS11]MDP9634616.1 hypothetical protein [Ensifer adhaerens]